MIKQVPYQKEKLFKCIPLVALFISFFAFSGYATLSSYQSVPTSQIELVDLKNNETRKRPVSYNKACAIVDHNTSEANAYQYETNSLQVYNRLISVRLNACLKQSNSHKTSDRYLNLPIKTISQGSDEPYHTSLIG